MFVTHVSTKAMHACRTACAAVQLRSFGCTGLSDLRAQALAQLRGMFPSVPVSAIADAHGKAGGNVEQAVDLLFKAAQARPACTVGTKRASPPTAHPGGQAAVCRKHPQVRVDGHT
jgi:hypothetical protein